jgi:hypothetical protein
VAVVDFYATAAQVIPVLYLVMVFETRYLTDPLPFENPRHYTPFLAVARVWVAVTLIAGEGAALWGIYDGGQREGLVNRLVVLALVTGCSGALIPVLLSQASYVTRWWAENRSRDDWWIPVVMTLLLALLTLAIVMPAARVPP